jgi:hypothetical protein
MQRFSFCLVVILFLCNSTKRIHEMHNALSNDTSHYEHAWSFSNILRTSFQVLFVIAVFSNQHYTVHINKTQEISEALHTSFWSLNAEVGQRITMCTLVQCSSATQEIPHVSWNLKVHCLNRTISWAWWTQFTLSHSISSTSPLILFFHVPIYLHICVFPSGFPTKLLIVYLVSPMYVYVTYFNHLAFVYFNSLKIFCGFSILWRFSLWQGHAIP